MIEGEKTSAILSKSWKHVFKSGVAISVKRRFCNKCNDKTLCDECNNRVNKEKKGSQYKPSKKKSS